MALAANRRTVTGTATDRDRDAVEAALDPQSVISSTPATADAVAPPGEAGGVRVEHPPRRAARSSGLGHLPVQPLIRRPRVSVVIPCYRYGHHVAGAVASVLGQPDVDVDVVVIDDASPDGSGAVATAIADSDPRVRAMLHAHNRGHIATFNEGLDAAEGDYVVLLAADDLLTPGSLARATALLDAHPNVGFVYGHPREFSDVPPPAGTAVRSWRVWAGHDWLARRCRRGSNCIFCPEVVMRRSVREQVGGFDPALPHRGDLAMWLRMATVADVGRVVGADQGYHRIHPASMQRTIHAGHLRDLEERRAAFASVLLDPASRLSDGPALYARARRALAASALDRVRWAVDTGATEEPIDEYLAFAAEVDPVLAGSFRGRAARRRCEDALEHPDPDAIVRSRLIARDLTQRVRWRRWRRSGV